MVETSQLRFYRPIDDMKPALSFIIKSYYDNNFGPIKNLFELLYGVL